MLATVGSGDVTVVTCDGSPSAATAVSNALRAALDGGPAVLPVGADQLGLAAAMRPHEPSAAALIVATSGSTGAPKGVELAASALVASATATHARLGGPGRWLLALPPQHVAGAQVLVRSILAGVEAAVLDVRERFTGAAFAALAETTDCRHTSLVPTQLVRVLDDDRGRRALMRFDAVLVGGAACPPALLDRAREAGARIVTTYGMSETAGGCVYDGVPLDGVHVRIADAAPTGGPDGRVEVAGPVLALGYRGDPEATARAFRDGWFRTDDAGAVHDDGTVSIIGRLDDVIVTGGRKIAPAAVERAIAGVDGVAEVCVVGVPDPEWGHVVAAAVVADPQPERVDVRAAARAAAGPAAAPKVILFVRELPLRGPGKVDRAAVRAMLVERWSQTSHDG